MTSCRSWTADDDRRLRAMRAAVVPYRQIATALGRTVGACTHRGYLIGATKGKGTAWTPAEDFRLMGMVEQHRGYAAIAAALGRTEAAVRNRASVLGAVLRTANGRSLAEVERLLGLGRNTGQKWVRRGWLRAHRAGDGPAKGTPLVVEDADLMAFLGDERHWHLVDPARIGDRPLRDWVTEQRRGLTFLTTAEAGKRLALDRGWITELVSTGRMRGVVRGRTLLIRSDWLVYPTRLPGGRGPRQVTTADHPAIRRWWGRLSMEEMARRLGLKSAVGIAKAAREMGLPPLGRGYWRRARAA